MFVLITEFAAISSCGNLLLADSDNITYNGGKNTLPLLLMPLSNNFIHLGLTGAELEYRRQITKFSLLSNFKYIICSDTTYSVTCDRIFRELN